MFDVRILLLVSLVATGGYTYYLSREVTNKDESNRILTSLVTENQIKLEVKSIEYDNLIKHKNRVIKVVKDKEHVKDKIDTYGDVKCLTSSTVGMLNNFANAGDNLFHDTEGTINSPNAFASDSDVAEALMQYKLEYYKLASQLDAIIDSQESIMLLNKE